MELSDDRKSAQFLSDHDPLREAMAIDGNGFGIRHLKFQLLIEGHVLWFLGNK